ncbi:MAG: excinuclease ABC subunit UvrA [Candidatus Pacebacteria bacterium]|nr:excinuclease ABC subunit UvrA [Candidatus Paceibacterota bacterium]
MEKKFIEIKGAKVNNLKNISLKLPRNKFVVITGLSGSGKSSLAFDTIYAEGQRRYVESLSAYARQFIDLMDKPDVEMIEGLSPAISIDQKSVSHNPRSTVGTITEVYDYLRLMFAKIGIPHCPVCHKKLTRHISKDSGHNPSVFLVCRDCNFHMTELKPGDFSFNSSQGACPSCGGLGTRLELDPKLIINEKLSFNQGAIRPLSKCRFTGLNQLLKDMKKTAEKYDINLDESLKSLEAEKIKIILYGKNSWQGIIPFLQEKYDETESQYIHQELNQYMRVLLCSACSGKRLKPEFLAVKILSYNISDFVKLNITELKRLLNNIDKDTKMTLGNKKVYEPIVREIKVKLGFLENVGLEYLTLDRGANTLSGGEAQRIRLATQAGSSLIGVLYILDEPSIGLHQRDNNKLIHTLKALTDKGNSVIVVEHDEATILAADHIIDVGPGAGEHGGHIVFQGTATQIKKDKKSLTGQYLSGLKKIESPKKKHKGNNKYIEIIKASEHNLKNIDVKIPLGKFVAITGVSGSGKSTLMTDILARALSKKFYRAKTFPGKHKEIKGLENIDKVINIDQSPIGRTPRSNPATYTGAFTPIRELFAELPEAKLKGYDAGSFSFNVAGGRCENCSGEGYIKVEMQFLSDVYIKCDVCSGKRYRKKILDIYYRDKNIYDVLEMTVEEAMNFFRRIPAIYQKLNTLYDVGLGYIKLGQPATTLSGGEAQRIKLATELSRRATGKTLYILDEPTTGLHFADIDRLLKVLYQLVDKGNTVLIIEHNLDVIKSVDWVIDLGPEGGDKGGEIVAEGSPEEVAKIKKSYTGQYLKGVI